ncbi:MAG: rod shape-determining protein MreC [Acidobacteriota bacterium]
MPQAVCRRRPADGIRPTAYGSNMRIALRHRPIWVLTGLVLFNFLLTSLQVRNRDGAILLKVWMMDTVGPVASLINRQGSALSYYWTHYVDLRNAQRERDRLAAENLNLKMDLARHREYKGLVERMQRTDQVRSTIFYDTLAATVIAKSPPFVTHVMTINRGRRDGLLRDHPVLGDGAVLGRIVAVSEGSAEVEVITNAGAAAGVLLADNRLEGIVEGNGSGRLALSYVPNHEEVRIGEMVLTSGTDQIYPKGLIVGKVVRSEKSKSTLFRVIEVEPVVRFDRIEEVLVVISERPKPVPPPAAAVTVPPPPAQPEARNQVPSRP